MFLSYAREDTAFVERSLTGALVRRGKDVWIDVEDIRGGASDWRASVWAGIESATVMVFVLTPDSLASTVCGEELQRADELNKRIIPVLRRSVDGLPLPPALARPNWILARPEDDFEASVTSLVDALELDEAWVEQHARLAQRTGEWLRHDRDGSYLLRGSDLRSAESWLDDQGAHKEAPTAQQVGYITASRRAAARRQRGLLAGVGLALVLTTVLAIVALAQRATAIHREQTARAQARAAQSIAALSRDPEESVRDALEAVDIRADEPEAIYALRRAVSTAGWTSILRLQASRRAGLLDVEFSADGSRVATAGSDGRAAVWNTRTGRRVTVVTPGAAVHTVQFSPNGRQLLTGSEDGIARIWNSSTGRLLREFDAKSKDAWAATYGAGGRRILTASLRRGEVWAAGSGASLRQLGSAGAHLGAVRMSLDGRRVLTAGEDGTALLWNVATGKSVTLPGKKTDPLAFSLFSSGGRRYATFYDSGRFCVWEDARVTPRFCRAGSKSTDVDFSRDGRRVLRAGRNAIVEVWDVGSRRPHRLAVLHNGGTVSSAQFDRSGEYVVTAGDDGVARVWQVKSPRQVSALRGHTDGVIRARFSPAGSQIATVSDDGSGRLWPARPRTPADPRWQSAAGTAFSPNSRDVLVVRRDRRSAVWNTDTGRIVALRGRFPVTDPLTRPCGRVSGCSPWSPDGRFVAGADAAAGAVVWDAHTGDSRRFGKKTGTSSGAAFSPDGRRLVVVDSNRKGARIWDVASRTPRSLVPGDFLFSAQFVANPLRVLTVDISAHAHLFDQATGANLVLSGNVLPVGVAPARNGQQFAVGTTDGKVRVLSSAGTTLRSGEAPGGAVSALAFDRTGTMIVTGGQKGTAVTWDVGTLTPTLLRAPGGEVTGATFGGRDGDLVLVTAGATARLWDRTLPRVIVELPRTPDVRAELSPDGSRIVIAGKTRLEVLRCDACASLEDLERRARSLLPAS